MAKPKDLSISLLLDFYGNMLTQKQFEAADFYHNDDMSLAEIAEHSGITRQGVRDAIKRAERQLLECESKLGLAARFGDIQSKINIIRDYSGDIYNIASKRALSAEICEKARTIYELSEELSDET
jgi:predicted DNA-binding protein YlxM (UPF0122 family)